MTLGRMNVRVGGMAQSVAAVLLLLGASGCGDDKSMNTNPMAIATINEPMGTQGSATFEETTDGVKITISLDSVPNDGMHGLHVHATGDCSDTTGAMAAHHGAAGGHFNPDNVNHGCPPATPHHAGDLGNIVITGGKGTATITTKELTVAAGDRSVVGKAIIVHGGADDCTGQPAGNSGARIACAAISAK